MTINDHIDTLEVTNDLAFTLGAMCPLWDYSAIAEFDGVKVSVHTDASRSEGEASFGAMDAARVKARARIIACWNACDGLTLDAVEGLGAGGVARLVEALRLMHNRLSYVMSTGAVKHSDQNAIAADLARVRALLDRMEGK